MCSPRACRTRAALQRARRGEHFAWGAPAATASVWRRDAPRLAQHWRTGAVVLGRLTKTGCASPVLRTGIDDTEE